MTQGSEWQSPARVWAVGDKGMGSGGQGYGQWGTRVWAVGDKGMGSGGQGYGQWGTRVWAVGDKGMGSGGQGYAGPYLRGGGEGHSPPLVSFSPPLECSTSHDTIELPPGAPPPLLSIPQIRPPSAKFLYTALDYGQWGTRVWAVGDKGMGSGRGQGYGREEQWCSSSNLLASTEKTERDAVPK